MKLSQDQQACAAFGLHKVSILEDSNEILCSEPGKLGGGGNSGFQALNLAIQFGAKKIVLIGFDLRLDNGVHWHGPHVGELANPNQKSIIRWQHAFDGSAKKIAGLGIEVLNASPDSALTAYPRMTLSEAICYLKPEIAATVHKSPPLYINIPAWGEFYVDLACRYTIPAALASIKQSNFKDVTFLIHTLKGEQDAYRRAIGDHKIDFMSLLPMQPPPKSGKMPRLPDNYWVAFKRAHKDAIANTPKGSIVALLNSDIVVSRECFSYVDTEMARGKKVVASVGIRTSNEDRKSEPPIGASADDLFRWIWANPHHITQECVWGRGRSQHPTILFFEDESGVSMRCFHLTPMFIKKDRHLEFKGTIDDDLLSRFHEDEISYPHSGEVAFAEISPNWKTHPFGRLMTPEHVLEFWERRAMRPHYLRNFKQRMRVLGNPTKDHPAIEQIITGLTR